MELQKVKSEFEKLTGMTPDEFKEMFERVKTMNEKENRFLREHIVFDVEEEEEVTLGSRQSDSAEYNHLFNFKEDVENE